MTRLERDTAYNARQLPTFRRNVLSLNFNAQGSDPAVKKTDVVGDTFDSRAKL
jgi:hypothetical protein